jgi:hypothetical protein
MVAGDLAGPLLGAYNDYHTRYVKPDCIVNYHDLFFMFEDWLYNEPNLDFTGGGSSDPGTGNLAVWYKFDDPENSPTITDSQNGRNGTLYNAGPFTWWYAGYDDTGKCVNFEPGFHTWIDCPNTVAVSGTTGQSFTFWMDWNDEFVQPHEWASVLAFHANPPGVTGNFGGKDWDNQTTEMQLPCPWYWGAGQARPWIRWVDMRYASVLEITGMQGQRPSKFSDSGSGKGRWNHYALVYKPATSMTMYINGTSNGARTDGNLADHGWGPSETGDGNANSVRIGQRSNAFPTTGAPGTPWNPVLDTNSTAFWHGKLDDLRIYSKALSENEVHYLATGGIGTRNMQAIFVEPENLDDVNTAPLTSGGPKVQIINFSDFAKLAEYWATNGQQYQLWP